MAKEEKKILKQKIKIKEQKQLQAVTLNDIKDHCRRVDEVKQRFKLQADSKFYNQVINAEAASQSSLAPDQMYQDPLLRELKEKEKFKKKILLKKKFYIRQVNDQQKA